MPESLKIPPPRVPFIDARTGLVAREWYRYLQLRDVDISAIQLSLTSTGAVIPGLDGADGEDGFTIIGPRGPQGVPGLTIPGMDGQDGNEVFMNPPGSDGGAATHTTLKLLDDLTMPKTAGKGIRVDPDSPTFGWKDLIGELAIRAAGANDPTFAVYRGTLRDFQFSNAVMNEVYFDFHIPHDYVPRSDIYIHVHWSQIVVDSGGTAGAPGQAKWSFECTYAKGHDQAAFPAPITLSVTQTASGVQYRHMLAELQLSAGSPTASQLDSDDLEPDGIIILRAYRDPADAADTLNQAPFVHHVDIHYQATNLTTKQKAPNFYT